MTVLSKQTLLCSRLTSLLSFRFGIQLIKALAHPHSKTQFKQTPTWPARPTLQTIIQTDCYQNGGIGVMVEPDFGTSSFWEIAFQITLFSPVFIGVSKADRRWTIRRYISLLSGWEMWLYNLPLLFVVSCRIVRTIWWDFRWKSNQKHALGLIPKPDQRKAIIPVIPCLIRSAVGMNVKWPVYLPFLPHSSSKFWQTSCSFDQVIYFIY